MNQTLGKHLIIDGSDCNYQTLCNVELVRSFLDSLPEQIDMKKILPALSFPWTDCQPEEWGVTGFVLISTSHITIHTFPEKRFLFADCFSCKAFNEKRVMGLFVETFGIKHLETRTIDRGASHGISDYYRAS